jgi:hypothetical protein
VTTCTTRIEGPVFVETAYSRNGRHAGWNEVGTFRDRAAAWAWLQSRGYKAEHKGDKFLVSPGRVEDVDSDGGGYRSGL